MRRFLPLIWLALLACTDATTTSQASPDGGASDRDASKGDGGRGDEDGGGATDAGGDAPSDAGATKDANGAGEAGTECVFNADCQAALRCSACDAGYCFCEPGARGTGKNGIDACDSGDQCESALCVEGPPASGASYCSDDCSPGAATCTGMLPKCVTVPGFATFCARDGG